MLKEVYIHINENVNVFHTKGYFVITHEELLEIIDNKGNIKHDKLNALYDYKYHPKWMAA